MENIIEQTTDRFNFHIARLEWYADDRTQTQAVREDCAFKAGQMVAKMSHLHMLLDSDQTEKAEEYALEMLTWINTLGDAR